jgi:hypothetical protein
MRSGRRHGNACGRGDLLNNLAGGLLDSNLWAPHKGRRLRDAQPAAWAAMRGTSSCWAVVASSGVLEKFGTAALLTRGVIFDGPPHVNIAHRNPTVRFRTHPEFSRRHPRTPDFKWKMPHSERVIRKPYPR